MADIASDEELLRIKAICDRALNAYGGGAPYEQYVAATTPAAVLRLLARIEAADALIGHIWLHVTSDENFDADEIIRDIKNSRMGKLNELRDYQEWKNRAERAEAEVRRLQGMTR